jgi:hypothetical protein
MSEQNLGEMDKSLIVREILQEAMASAYEISSWIYTPDGRKSECLGEALVEAEKKIMELFE